MAGLVAGFVDAFAACGDACPRLRYSFGRTTLGSDVTLAAFVGLGVAAYGLLVAEGRLAGATARLLALAGGTAGLLNGSIAGARGAACFEAC